MSLVSFNDFFSNNIDGHVCFIQFSDKEEGAPPAGSYRIRELFCANEACNCRIAHIVFISVKDGKEYGTVRFGWEDKAFYDEYFGSADHGFPGPTCDPEHINSYTNCFLSKFKELYGKDEAYIAMLKNYYHMVREEVKERDLPRNVVSQTYRRPAGIPKRNDPCPCGSGKKHKKCCLNQEATCS